jgi:ATP-dependent Clp protease ATP-binding subunit ClpA
MFERFTDRARRAVVDAREEARRLGHRQVGTGHLLLGLVAGDGLAARVLLARGVDEERLRDVVVRLEAAPARRSDPEDVEALAAIGIDLSAVTSAVEEAFGEGALSRPRRGRRRRSAPFGPMAKHALTRSLKEALRLGHNYIGTEHILIAVVAMGEGTGHRALVELAAPVETLRDDVLAELDRVRRGA